MPRDLTIDSVRVRSPAASMLRTISQVSISEEIPTSLRSVNCSPLVRLVNSAVMPLIFIRSTMTHQHRQCISRATSLFETGHRIEDDDLGLKVVDQLEHAAEVNLQPEAGGTGGSEAKVARGAPAVQVDADRPHVAHDLIGRFLKCEIDTALPTLAGGIHEMRGDAALSGSGAARNQHGAAPKIPLSPNMASSFGIPVEMISRDAG